MCKFTTTAALLAGAFLFTGCSTQTSSTSIDTRLDRIETALAELKESQAVLTASAERLDAVLDETEVTAGDSALASSLQSQLRTVRSQIELYKNQHNGVPPAILHGWGQLTYKTDINGKVGRGHHAVYGPYLYKPPVNPFTGSSHVCPIDEIDRRAGWVWDENGQMFYAVVTAEIASAQDLRDDDVVIYDSGR